MGGALTALAALVGRAPGGYGLVSLLGPSGLRVVVYHSVADKPGPCVEGLGVNVSPEVWSKHLDHFEREYSIVDLETVLQGRLPKRPLLITFDDGYLSVAQTVAPELRRRGLPAVLFATTAALGSRRLMLDNVLCYLANTVGVARLETTISGRASPAPSLPALFDEVVASLPYTERRALAGRLVEEFGVDEESVLARYRLYLEPGDIRRLVELGFEIGSHTESHVHCRSLGPDEAQREIVDAAAMIAKLAGRPVRAFSYPYGSATDATPIVRQALRSSGQEIAFLVAPGTNGRRHVGQDWYRVAMDWPGPESPFVRLEVRPRLSTLRRIGRAKAA
jgi:peptidoglycan/xylan/chitin deacetylase (PgdA/CDA1 family)